MAIKKPALLDISNPKFDLNVKELLEILTGRRSGKVNKIDVVQASDITGAPAAADYNKLVEDVNVLRAKINEIIDRLQD